MRTHFIRVQGVFAILIIGLTIFSCKNENKENISNENKKAPLKKKELILPLIFLIQFLLINTIMDKFDTVVY